ncbi:GNAT family N-acetyltransferase [Cohnella panacarvi]|uniref:GNAT family N-acetyltransferase n=1 Tax=Cohnella panacarvi TaxID=400776 RepID=UPI00047A671A|nr:GNAT family protein [Cohnella panacarvi]
MPHLYGERIKLREFRKEDLPWIRLWVNNPEIVNHLSDIFLYPHTQQSTEDFLDSMLEGKPDGRGFVICEHGSEQYIGSISLDAIDWKNRVGTIGIVIGFPEYLGHGIGTEALKLLVAFAFRELNLNRLELQVYDFNVRAIRSYRKCGFQEEGRLRQRLYKNGRYIDVVQMGLLRSEWETSDEQTTTAE